MILLAFGANLPSIYGDPEETLNAAFVALEASGVKIMRASSNWRTKPVPPDPSQPDFVNAVAEVATPHTPEALLSIIMDIERQCGRTRTHRNAARQLDIDILAYHDITQNQVDLSLPHPRMHMRRFVLAPLTEIEPDWIHPILRTSARGMLDLLPENAHEFCEIIPTQKRQTA